MHLLVNIILGCLGVFAFGALMGAVYGLGCRYQRNKELRRARQVNAIIHDIKESAIWVGRV